MRLDALIDKRLKIVSFAPRATSWKPGIAPARCHLLSMTIFQPTDITGRSPYFSSQLPEEIWLPILESDCTFPAQIFNRVLLNLIKNPNITSNYLFRADILYDSVEQLSVDGDHREDVGINGGNINSNGSGAGGGGADGGPQGDSVSPKPISVPGYSLDRSIVRRLIPRNPQLDAPLVQTCHVLSNDDNSQNLVIYLPHVSDPSDMPWYHPPVAGLAFLYSTRQASSPTAATPTSTPALTCPSTSTSTSVLSLHYLLFPASPPLTTRILRTANKLLQTIHKHGHSTQAGYVKRVHHDLIIPQRRFQDTYTRLKATHAKRLVRNWVEHTDPGKHVFEDLGIAAFLIELWTDMYDVSERRRPVVEECMSSGDGVRREGEETKAGNLEGENRNASEENETEKREVGEQEKEKKPPFPGFVDIGCGNGILVDILLREGYSGWGFDARARKSWTTFPAAVQEQLHELILVPAPLVAEASGSVAFAATSTEQLRESGGNVEPGTRPKSQAALTPDPLPPGTHSGVFPENMFIISNHADELTPWTPLLASLSSSPFLALPCCSHDLGGARFRAPARYASSNVAGGVAKKGGQGGQKGGAGKSAYASLVGWVEHLSREAGFEVRREMLRIPSTRNTGLVGYPRSLLSSSSSSSTSSPFSSGEHAERCEDGEKAEQEYDGNGTSTSSIGPDTDTENTLTDPDPAPIPKGPSDNTEARDDAKHNVTTTNTSTNTVIDDGSNTNHSSSNTNGSTNTTITVNGNNNNNNNNSNTSTGATKPSIINNNNTTSTNITSTTAANSSTPMINTAHSSTPAINTTTNASTFTSSTTPTTPQTPTRIALVRDIIAHEGGCDDAAGWIERALKLTKGGVRGH
ncbi:MAG: hypothetical protein M1819_004196 [Sarea resinae]|nr:MAG: hypothetical protein M1819_004196 [Sarea resinae]